MVSASTYSMSGVLRETYKYDALGNRIEKTTDGKTTSFVIDYSSGYAQVLRATTDNGTIFYTRGFELISRKDAGGELWYLTDGVGSVRCLTDSSGSITDTLVFDAFGNNISRTGETGDSYGFQGEQQDATGLYYLRARYMNPATGSFTQMDTYAGTLSHPITQNKYLFANSNPMKFRDPSGHSATLLETQLGIAICFVLASAYEMKLYADDYSAQVQMGKEYNYGEYAGGIGMTFLRGCAFQMISMICVAVIAVFSLTILEMVLCSCILAVVGLNSEMLAGTLDVLGHPFLARILRFFSALCFAGSFTFIVSAGSAAVASTKSGASSSGSVADDVAGSIENPVIGKPRTGSASKNDVVDAIRDGKNQIIKEFPATAKAHGFSDIVDNYAGDAVYTRLPDGADLYQLLGSNNGVNGRFEWIVENGTVVHRMFVENGTLNGRPIIP